jgi:hypothetical protein
MSLVDVGQYYGKNESNIHSIVQYSTELCMHPEHLQVFLSGDLHGTIHL